MSLTSLGYRTITDPTNQPIEGVVVIARLRPVNAAIRVDDSSVISGEVRAVTDAYGYYSFPLERNGNITPSNTFWEIEERIPRSKGGTKVWAVVSGTTDFNISTAGITTRKVEFEETPLTLEAGDLRYAPINTISSDIFEVISWAAGDRWAAISTVLATVSALGGGAVMLKNGAHLLSQALPAYDNVEFFGETKSGAILKAMDGVDFINLIAGTGKTNWVMHTLTLDANYQNRSGALTSYAHGATFTSFSKSRVYNVTVKNTLGNPAGSPSNGIAFAGNSNDCEIYDCDADTCGTLLRPSDGFYIGAGSRNKISRVKGHLVYDTVAVLEGCSDSAIDGVIGYSCGSFAAITALGASDSNTNSIANVIGYDWFATVPGAINIRATGAGNLFNTTVSGLNITNLTGAGPCINVAKPSTGRVIGLVMGDLQIYGAGTQGILLTSAEEVILSNYSIKNTASYPISINSCTKVRVYPGRVNVTAIPGISVDSSSDVSIDMPDIDGTPTYGIYLFNSGSNIKIKSPAIQGYTIFPIGADAGILPLIDIEGTGSPENNIPAAKASIYRRTDGGAGTCLYVKESVAGQKTGWVAK